VKAAINDTLIDTTVKPICLAPFNAARSGGSRVEQRQGSALPSDIHDLLDQAFDGLVFALLAR
jgi:hypothetical protein